MKVNVNTQLDISKLNWS